jgi:hypothetical protein
MSDWISYFLGCDDTDVEIAAGLHPKATDGTAEECHSAERSPKGSEVKMKTLAIIALLLASALVPVKANTDTQFVPPCPQASYGADGNMGPLFCVVINPVAFRYFAPMAKRTFALGPDASPEQVASALIADFGQRHGTLPILCSIYELAAWKNHWSPTSGYSQRRARPTSAARRSANATSSGY